MNTKEVNRIVEALNEYEGSNGTDYQVEEYEGVNRGRRDKDYARICTESSTYETGKEYHRQNNEYYADTFNPSAWWSMEYVVESMNNTLMPNVDREVRFSTGSNNVEWRTHNHEQVSHRKEYRMKIWSSYNEPTSSIKKVEVTCFVNTAGVMTAYHEIDLNDKNLGSRITRLLNGQPI